VGGWGGGWFFLNCCVGGGGGGGVNLWLLVSFWVLNLTLLGSGRTMRKEINNERAWTLTYYTHDVDRYTHWSFITGLILHVLVAPSEPSAHPSLALFWEGRLELQRGAWKVNYSNQGWPLVLLPCANIETGTIRNPRLNSWLIHDALFLKNPWICSTPYRSLQFVHLSLPV